MKHILIDGTPISRQMDGLTQYILNVVLRLDVSCCRYTLLLRPAVCPADYLQAIKEKGIAIEEVAIAPIGPLRDIQFARYLSSHSCFDAAFIPSNQYPRALRLPSVYVIHDLIYERFPEQLGRLASIKRWYLRQVVRKGLRHAQHVVAVSRYTKDEIIRCYGKQFESKIRVVYEGWEHLLNTGQSKHPSCPKLDFDAYILYVGSSRDRKSVV